MKKPPLFLGINHVKAFVSNDTLDPENMRQAKNILFFKRNEVRQIVDIILEIKV